MRLRCCLAHDASRRGPRLLRGDGVRRHQRRPRRNSLVDCFDHPERIFYLLDRGFPTAGRERHHCDQCLLQRSMSGRGTKSSDTYSLKGLAEALDKVGQECK